MSDKETKKIMKQLKAVPIRSTQTNTGRLTASLNVVDKTEPDGQLYDQLDTQLFGLNNSGYGRLEEQLCAVVNWANEASIKYTLSYLPSYSGLLIKFHNPEEAALFKLSWMVD